MKGGAVSFALVLISAFALGLMLAWGLTLWLGWGDRGDACDRVAHGGTPTKADIEDCRTWLNALPVCEYGNETPPCRIPATVRPGR